MPKATRRFPQPAIPSSVQCVKAHSILCKAADAAESFHVVFREQRGQGPGTSSDAQQDVLRAMLVFACAGLDSALKQLVRDALEDVINRSPRAQQSFQESVRRKIPDIERSQKLLAAVLTAVDPRGYLLRETIKDLLEGSLQSVKEFSKVAAALDVETKTLVQGLQEAFDARNQIIHEMDINFGTNRSRRPRRRDDMERMTEHILNAAAGLLDHVDKKLAG
jgi:hypothetical protein